MRIKVINLPDYHHYDVIENCYRAQYPSLPSAVAVIRENGFKTDQDDLNAKLFHENTSPGGERISIEPFADGRRMEAFFDSGGDPEIEEIGERILKLTKTKGYDLIAFSAPDQNGIFTGNLLHLLSHLLKREDNPYILVGGRVEEGAANGRRALVAVRALGSQPRQEAHRVAQDATAGRSARMQEASPGDCAGLVEL